MKNTILTFNMSDFFINTLIKSELLKRKLNLKQNPILFVLIENNNEFSDYMKSLGYTKENLKRKYGITENSIINLTNDLSDNEINLIFEEYINQEFILNRVLNGYSLTCEDIFLNELKKEAI